MALRPPPFVSVVVPVYNEPRLCLALDALRGQTYDQNRYEIVVCDNGSAVDVGPLVERITKDVSARVVRELTPGSYAARNAGIRVAAGAILAFTDADCLPAADWLASGVSALEGPARPDLVAGRIELFAAGPRPTLAEQFELLQSFPQRRYVERDRFGVTANLLVRREVVDEVGPFDQTRRSGGDREFCNRATDANFQLHYDAEVLVRHPARRTMRELRRKQRRTSAGLLNAGFMQTTLRDAVVGLRPPIRRIRRARHRDGIDSTGVWLRYAAALTFIHYGFAIDRVRHVLRVLPDRR